jgi:Cu/Ag efflux pump CusA
VALERAPGSEARSGLTLGDVARVTEDHQPLIGDAVVDDGPGLVMVIEKLPSANTVEVTEGVEDALETLAPGLQGISVDTNVFRPASFVEQARDNYLVTVGIGLLLAFLVVLLIAMSMRTILVALVTTVVSAAGSLVVLNLLGVDLNVMVLAGLALAAMVVVQDSVGDAAAVVRRWREPSTEAALPRMTAAILEMRRSLGFATAVAVAAMLPLLALDRLSEAFLRPALLAFVLTVLVSSLVALTVSPALWSVLLRDAPERRSGPSERLHRAIEGAVRRSARATAPVVVGVLALGVAVGAAVLPFLHTDDRAAMLPEFQESDVVVSWRGEPGISRPAMTAIAAELGAELRTVPGVESVGGHVGRAILSDQINGIGEGELWVGLAPDADHGETVAGLRAVAEDYDGAEAEVRSFVADRVEAVGGLLSEYDRGRLVSEGDEVVVRIYGEELPVLIDQADAIEQRLGELGDVDGVRVELPPVEPNLEVEVDLEQAERYGLKPGDIRRTATTLANGLRVGSLFEEQKVFDVIVNGEREYFADPARIGELLIGTPAGGTVPLDRVADVRSGESFSAINRESVSRRLDLVATVSGDRGDAVDAIEDALTDVEFPLEYHAEVIGPEAGETTDWRWVLAAGAVGLIAALLLLQMAARSWRMTAAMVATVLFSLAGGAVAVALAGGEVTIGSALGFLGVLLVAVRGSLCLLGHHIALRGGPIQRHDAEIVARGAADQALPVLLSGVVAVAVLLPAVVVGVRPGLEILHPMAVVVIGGAVAATAANLLLLPAMYLRWGGRLEPDVLEQAADVRSPVSV